MNKELKNVLSKTEPSNTNVVWYHPTEGGIIPKVFRGGWQALIQGAAGDNTQVIEWSHTHNMNDYKDAGTYRIKGERTGNPLDDNLPIMNQGSGHTIDGILYVLDSSLANGSGKESDCTITQFLMLSNRVGGQEGDMYMRSAYGVNKDSLTWKPWEKFQTNIEVGVVSNDAIHDATTLAPINSNGLKTFVDNGIYSGVYLTQEALSGDSTKAQTFVMVVINNYAAAGDNKTITQIKFAVTNAGEYSMERRIRGFDGKWSGWINEYNDLYTRIDEIEKEIATKQQELTLTVLDNGNIRIGNLKGQTKDFMPATPSGDPMHEAYRLLGSTYSQNAVYNNEADVIKKTLWESLVDDADYNAKWGLNLIPDDATFVKTLKYNGVDREVWEFNNPLLSNRKVWAVAEYASDGTKIWDDKVYVSRGGMWSLASLGDLTNADMRKILLSPHITNSLGSCGTDMGRVVCKNGLLSNTRLPMNFLNNASSEVLMFGYAPSVTNEIDLPCKSFYTYAYLSVSKNIKAVNMQYCKFKCDGTTTMYIPKISVRSIIYALNNTKESVTITFPSALYDRLMDTTTTLGAELVALLESKSNITFARGE